jgi:stage III sporulation protein AC
MRRSGSVPDWPPPSSFSDAMEVDLIFKIAAVGIIVSILNQVLVRTGREEQATMTTLAGLIVVLMIVVQRIADLFALVKTLFEF